MAVSFDDFDDGEWGGVGALPVGAGLKMRPSDVVAFLARAVPAWHADALCKEFPSVSWFPEQGVDARTAKAICARCPVRVECLAAAVARGEKFGIWGGLSAAEVRRRRVA